MQHVPDLSRYVLVVHALQVVDVQLVKWSILSIRNVSALVSVL